MKPIGVLLLVIVGAALLSADTLVLRDGRRVRGELVGLRADVLEFDEETWRGRRTLRVNRDEVDRIEFDESRMRDDGAARGGRPSGLREREVVVSGDVPWNDTGVDVRAGQTVFFEATGRVRWGPDRRDGPAGEGGSPFNANRPIPRRPAAALIGRVGAESTDYFFVGDERGPIRMRATGRLFLGINDDYLQDNSGNFRVTVFY